MRTWSASTTTCARPEAVLRVLTDPEACRRWAPVDFDVTGLAGGRLVAGSRARVTGRVAGLRVGFDVAVHAADRSHLALTASGPVGLDVAYELDEAGAGSEVRARVQVRPGCGLQGRLVAQATEALLAGGALHAAVGRIAREAGLAA
jgi:Polyketide cyclase / dehydrase and lipid transport